MLPAIAAAVVAGSALGSSILSAQNAKKEREAAEARREEAGKQIDSWQAEAQKILDEQDRNAISLSNPTDVATYKSLRKSYDPSRYILNPTEFDKSTYSVEDYLNPQKDAILADVAKAVQHTAAGNGMGRSSGTVKAMTRAAVEKSDALYDKAYERMYKERGFDYGLYTDYINQQQNRLDAMNRAYKDEMEMLRNDIEFDQSQTDAATQNRLSLLQSIAQTKAQLV